MNRGGLCESCLRPGNCCTNLALRGGPYPFLAEAPMSFEAAEHLAMRNSLPFRPLWQDADGIWRWWCPSLSPEGRCTIYETRPALCRSYAAGSDKLCFHHQDFESNPMLVKADE